MPTITSPGELREPPFARFLFADTRVMPWVWLVVRVYLAYNWLSSGFGKLFGEGADAWVGDNAGAAITGFVNGALDKTTGTHPDVSGWYAWFLENIVLPNAALFGHLIAWGETLVGLGLLLGALTGIAAFGGILMNANYLLSGTVSTNPIMLMLGVLVVLAWRNAGWIGLDRFLLPLLGTPWQPGQAFEKHEGSASAPPRDAAGNT